MAPRRPLSTARITAAAGLLAAAGILIPILAGIDFPTIPPGMIITLAGAGLVALVPWRWTPAPGTVIGLFLIAGLVLSGSSARLLETSPIVAFAGLWVQLLGLLAAAVFGVIATSTNIPSAPTVPTGN